MSSSCWITYLYNLPLHWRQIQTQCGPWRSGTTCPSRGMGSVLPLPQHSAHSSFPCSCIIHPRFQSLAQAMKSETPHHQGVVPARESESSVTKSLTVHYITPQALVSSGRLFLTTPSVPLCHDTPCFALFLSHFYNYIWVHLSLSLFSLYEKRGSVCLLTIVSMSLGIETDI